MDTSKEYIKMCSKAEEVQKLRRPTTDGFIIENVWEDGDIIKYPQGRVGLFNPLWFLGGILPEKYVWLPRQDQLQEMIKSREPGWGLMLSFWEFINDYKKSPIVTGGKFQIYSIEQLWIAFVMKELYQKKWVNGEWVKIGG